MLLAWPGVHLAAAGNARGWQGSSMMRRLHVVHHITAQSQHSFCSSACNWWTARVLQLWKGGAASFMG